MRYGPGWFLRMLVVVVAVGVLMSLAFGAGIVADGGSTTGGWGHAYKDGYYPGFRSLGCLVAIFVVIAIVGLIACALRGPGWPGGPRYYGGPGRHGRHRRYWHEDDWREDAESEMADWHRRAHSEAGPSAASEPAAPAAPKAPRGRAR